MARIGFSPLIVSASGKVGDTVFSRWKGRSYIRSRVTPANPETTDQVDWRARLAACVARYKELAADIKLRWDEYASPYQMSGYNQWVNYNNKGMEKAASPAPVYTPPNPDVAGPTDAAPVTGSGAGEIVVTWSAGKEGAGIYIEAIVMKQGAKYYDTALALKSHQAVLASVHSLTISGLTAGATYLVSVCTYDSNLTENKFSQAYTGTAAAHA
jgi:hypothetical protein